MDENNFNYNPMNDTPVTENPMNDQPATQPYYEPAYTQATPGYQQPAYQEPAYQQPAYQQPAYQQPVYQQPAYQQPAYQQPVAPAPTSCPAAEACASDAFGKGLAATIMAWFPVASIIAIAMGGKGLGLLEQAEAIAAQYGVSVGGKAIAAKILSKIGKIGGIAMTIFWGFYIFIIIVAAGSI